MDPCKIECSAHTINIEWTGHTGLTYIAKYRAHEKNDTFKEKQTTENKIQLTNLSSDTLYQINLYEENDNGEQSLSLSKETRTVVSIATSLIEKAVKEGGIPTIYRLDPINTTKISDGIQVQEFFSEVEGMDERTLILFGAKASGKSTMVDSIVNYITDVPFADNFRFRISVEKTSSSQQLEPDIVCYNIRRLDGFNVEFNINIIDVPEFDAIGLESDDRMYKRLLTLFGAVKIKKYAVCLVVPSFCRLTEDQRNIFKNILSVFGKDVSCIIPLITHDDSVGGESKAIRSLKKAKVPYFEHMHFSFNNANLFKERESEDIWDRRRKTMFDLFGEPTVFSNSSVKETQKVLKRRIKLNQYVSEANELEKSIVQIEELIKAKTELADNQTNTNTPEPHQSNADDEKICINCLKCEKTCVLNCSLAIELFWYFVIFFERICTWFYWICSCCGLCCSRFWKCTCNNSYCCYIRCLHKCIGCKCTCSFAHHKKQFGKCHQTRNLPGSYDGSDIDLQINIAKNTLTNLTSEYVTKYDDIVDTASDLEKLSLEYSIRDLKKELQHVKNYKDEIVNKNYKM